MVHFILEYAASVCDPHILPTINKLESIQCRTATDSHNDFSRFSSVTDMLSSLDLPLFQAQGKLLTFSKSGNGCYGTRQNKVYVA